MSTAFDMELFPSGVLTGSPVTRERHLRQAKAMQAAISKRWHRDNPWTWQHKHLEWFLNQCVSERSESTLYYYSLTAKLILLGLGAPTNTILKFMKNKTKARKNHNKNLSNHAHQDEFTPSLNCEEENSSRSKRCITMMHQTTQS